MTTQIIHSNLHLFLHFQWKISQYITIWIILQYRDIIISWPMYRDVYCLWSSCQCSVLVRYQIIFITMILYSCSLISYLSLSQSIPFTALHRNSVNTLVVLLWNVLCKSFIRLDYMFLWFGMLGLVFTPRVGEEVCVCTLRVVLPLCHHV